MTDVVVDPPPLPAREGFATDLRRRAARGTILNSGVSVGLSGLGLLQRLIAAAFLTQAEFGLWAVILTILVNLSWLKDLGITDKYIQQSEPDQELAFQKAFTLELYASLLFLVLVAFTLPLWALAYGHEEVIVGGLVASLVVPLGAFQAPAWIPYRRLQYGRNRLLTSVSPVVAFVVTVALAVAGTGYWSFIVGAVAGAAAGALVCTITSPYRLRLRLDRASAREYVSFSWPLVATGLSGLVFVQGSLLIVSHTVGLAGIGAIGIVIGIVGFAAHVDSIVSQTIYPAICRVVDRRDLLAETFVKSNRLALMWSLPFAVGLAMFADAIVTFGLGEQWRSAEVLLVSVGLCIGFGQIAFNWVIFMRALNDTRPILVAAALHAVVFLAVLLPATQMYGLVGYGIAFTVSTVIQVGIRTLYVSRLFKGFAVIRHTLRSIAPVVPAVTAVVLVRFASTDDVRLVTVLLEAALYGSVVLGATLLLERRLVDEMLGYLRGRAASPSPLH